MRLLALALVLPLLVLSGPAGDAASDVGATAEEFPAVPYLVGRKLHLPSGRVRTLPLKPADPRGLRLLGRTSAGWLVVDISAMRRATLYTVRGNQATKLRVTHGSKALPSWQWRLGTDGEHVIEVKTSSNYKTSKAAVIDVRTGAVIKQRFRKAHVLLDFDGSRAVLGYSKLVDWTVDETPVLRDVEAIAATISLDLLWRGSNYRWGPTSIEDPTEPPWVIDNGSPEGFPHVSPSGTFVAEWWPSGPLVFAMADGSYVGRAVPPPVYYGRRSLVWESDTSFLYEIEKRRHRRALMRCDITGACGRATPWTKPGEAITLAFEKVSDWSGASKVPE
jgi:hypothetical protein